MAGNGDITGLYGLSTCSQGLSCGDVMALEIVLQKMNFDLTPAQSLGARNILMPTSGNMVPVDSGGQWRKSILIAVPNTGYSMLWAHTRFDVPESDPFTAGIFVIPSGVVVSIGYSDTQEPIYMSMAPGTPSTTPFYVSVEAFYVAP